MGRADVWLKRSYITATCLVGIVSALLLGFTLFSHGHLHNEEEIEQLLSGLSGLYVISIIPLLLSIIGVYGVCKQKKWALISFTVGLILISLLVIGSLIHGLTAIPQVVKTLNMHYQSFKPLSDAGDVVQEHIRELQVELQCCGLDQGYVDWGHNISKSCLCIKGSTNPCVAAPGNLIHFETDGVQPVMVYKEPCLPLLIALQVTVVHVILGTMLGITLLWLLSVVLCIVILCRMNRKDNVPTVVYSPEAKAGNYITLTDTVEYT
ncbi:tetraspanin-8-like [Notolabrus celidotus]|uniref:tetraspanin-8-like n=1 Tax=Notolabrus celidotus TaxID=1203425 RepID=UPI0014905F46|nr:tetraspanin-8-like [Notolabrus celidotus]XP_034528879.1 tetraspanin-8-like [Notolabrus celidotus]